MRQHFAEIAWHVPATAEAIEQFIDCIAGGQIRFAPQPDRLWRDDHAEALPEFERLLWSAELFLGQITNQDRDALLVRCGRAGDDLNLRTGNLLETRGQILYRFAQTCLLRR